MKLALAAAVLVSVLVVSRNVGTAQGTGMLAITATSDRELRVWDDFVTRESRAGGLRMRTTDRDPAFPSRIVERFDQFHRGVRVWGGDLVRDSDRGVAVSIFGHVEQELSVGTGPSLTREAAGEALIARGGGDASLLSDPELVILRLDSGENRLAYTGVVSGEIGVARVFVDAGTGAELLQIPEIHTQAAVGTGRGVLGDQKKLSVLQQAGVFVTEDRHRPPVLTTYDMRGNLTRARTVIEQNGSLSASDLATDSDNEWTDPAAVDAHVHIGWTYDYYFKRFGRRGLDDRDRPVTVITNAVTQQGALTLPGNLQVFAINAFWCGGCGPGGRGLMFFGNGIPPGFFLVSTGQNFTYFAGALDIAAHELTHGVTDSSSRLIYRNESGALNEAFSDIMGASVEFFYHPAGTGTGRADYLIGEDIARPVRPGALEGFRSLEDPRVFGDPSHYGSRYTGTADNGGVHINSGIVNNVFYLAIEGGTHRTSGVTVQGVGAANREQIERIFYRAFVFMLPSSATFSTARTATVQAARDLFGEGSAPMRAVLNAWTAVGLF